jgi:hypothetical protein
MKIMMDNILFLGQIFTLSGHKKIPMPIEQELFFLFFFWVGGKITAKVAMFLRNQSQNIAKKLNLKVNFHYFAIILDFFKKKNFMCDILAFAIIIFRTHNT